MKMCRNAENERKHRFRENNPGYEARQKARERQNNELLRFHIRRNHLYGYGFPDSLDQTSKAFARVRAEFMETIEEQKVLNAG